MAFKDSWGGIRPGPGQNYTYLSICPAGVWWSACTGLMEYSLFCHHFYALSVSPVKKKLGLLFIMLLLWVYMLYSCVGYCATMPPSLVVDNSKNNRAKETDFLGKFAEAESGRPDLMMSKLLSRPQSSWTDVESDYDEPAVRRAPRDFSKDEADADRAEEWDDGRRVFPLSSFSNGSGNKKMPQAIIVGVKKGGTRALLEFSARASRYSRGRSRAALLRP